ncbi:MAG: reverse transcriptase domain-containing protein, partial [Candidatus Thiodiazotropha endolucinida]|nr:hypothetical protein [Candidatus Thiodiazotropha taylori]MCW4344792.1 reverse transcriptase domain-containing protein [Candidatus Thiodiazotropha endolucinida]
MGVRDSIFSRRRPDLELPQIECVWVEICIHNRKELLGTFYRPPNSNNAIYTYIEDSFGLAFDTNISNITITGDFNFDVSKQTSYRKIKDLCQHFNLDQIITETTHYTENSESIIDLFMVSNKNRIALSGVGEPFLDQNIRYHCPIYCAYNFNKITSPTYTRQIYLYHRGNYQTLSRELNETDWHSLKDDDVDSYAQNVTDAILNLVNKHIPNKTIHIRKSDPPWLTNDIKKLMRKRKRLYDKYKRTKQEQDFNKYKQVRNQVTAFIRKAKNDELNKLKNKLKDPNINQKDWWKTLKNFIKPEQQSSTPPLKADNIIISDEKEKADLLNDYFTQQTILDELNASLPQAANTRHNKLESIIITSEDVKSILSTLPTGKASGPDLIGNKILKDLAEPLTFPLKDLFNFCLENGRFPAMWKQANVTPIFKKDDPSEVSNYRPISLLSTVGKVLEKIVHKYIFNFFRENAIITTLQSGFVPGDSTVNQLTDMYNTFCQALDEGKEVRAIFCDISKAFDRVWHKGLLYKLSSVGISGRLLQWFSDYLENRKQRVVLPGTASSWTSIKAGVPQGSILGPLLFLIYINDIVEDIHSSIRLFADDTNLYIIVDDPVDASDKLNTDLSKINEWAKQWLVKFNPSKSESMVFSRKRYKPNHPPVFMNETQINEVISHKHLGVVFSNDCTWHEHLEYIKTKAWSRINIMRKLKFKLDRHSLQTIYFSFIRSLLEYADVVWDNCTLYEVNDLEKIQNEAARIVTGATKLVSIESLHNETKWESLASRRKKHKLQLFYKMQNNLTPNYLSSLVPVPVGNNSTYNLRNARDLSTVQAHSQLYYKSFLPSVVRDWNVLPEEIRNSPSPVSFKRQLDLNLASLPRYFCDGKRTGQIYHARLRMRCSSLNQHLFSRNIIDSPLCVCGAIETTQHFLFSCTRYTHLRQDLYTELQPICQPSLDVLLFGNHELSDSNNKQIFLAVQEFIIKTKRF